MSFGTWNGAGGLVPLDSQFSGPQVGAFFTFCKRFDTTTDGQLQKALPNWANRFAQAGAPGPNIRPMLLGSYRVGSEMVLVQKMTNTQKGRVWDGCPLVSLRIWLQMFRSNLCRSGPGDPTLFSSKGTLPNRIGHQKGLVASPTDDIAESWHSPHFRASSYWHM